MADELGLALAGFGIISGLAWRVPAVQRIDARLAQAIHSHPTARWLDHTLEFLRPLGNKWSLMAVVALVTLLDWQRGLAMAIAALVAAGLERGLKLWQGRTRPFLALEGIALRQGELPDDPGFPSGDAARVWFLLGSLTGGVSMPTGVVALAALATLLVSWGRVRLGAHYPLDVWGGAWLGFGIGRLWGDLLA